MDKVKELYLNDGICSVHIDDMMRIMEELGHDCGDLAWEIAASHTRQIIARGDCVVTERGYIAWLRGEMDD